MTEESELQFLLKFLKQKRSLSRKTKDEKLKGALKAAN